MPSLRSLYHSELDEYYVRMVKKLERSRVLVTELEHQLENTRELCIHLEEMLEPYLITPPKEPSSAISQCPPEILVEIFTWTLQDDHHPLIRRLLLVCKKWYDIIMHAPRLWSRMHIILDSRRIYSSLSLVPYVEACMARSGRLTLDIYISCLNWLLETQTVESLVADYVDQLHTVHNTPPLHYSFESYSNSSLYLIEQRDIEEEEVVTVILGEQGANMLRWRTLVFIGNGETDLWDFCGVSPSMEYLELTEIRGSGYGRSGTCFPDLSSLKTFKARECKEIAHLYAQCTAITSLHLNTKDTDFDGAVISSLLSLEKLHVYIQDGILRKTRTHSPINLPALRSLTLLGNIKNIMLARFNVPLLSTVVLGPTAGFHAYPRDFPSVLQLNFTEDRGLTASTVLQSLLPLHGVEEVHIQGCSLWTLDNALEQLAKSGKWPSTLQTIVRSVTEDGTIVTVKLPPRVESSSIRGSTPSDDDSLFDETSSDSS